MRYAMIMAGGSGTRLWPVSRQGEPKQLIRFIQRAHPESGAPQIVSLLEIAAERLEGLVPPERRSICTGEVYRRLINERLPAFHSDMILGEPAPRDTVNAVGFGAAVFGKEDPDAVFAVLTADHIIEPQDEFVRAMEVGYGLVEEDPARLVSFGIKPTHPATGFGYIEDAGPVEGFAGDSADLAFKIERFVEKPPFEKAREYLASGNFSWNAGMFVFHARTFMEMLERHVPESHAGLMKVRDAWGTSNQDAVLNEIYPTLPRTSVDYGVMEPAAKDPAVSLVGVRMDLSWLDVGSWPSYGETIAPDDAGNRVAGEAVYMHGCTNTVVVDQEGRHGGAALALVGCEDLIVVQTERATLVMPKDKAQDLKALHAELPDHLK